MHPQSQEKRFPFKWIGLGCGALLVFGLVSCFGFVFLIFGMLKNSEVYEMSMAAVQEHPEVVQELGEPLESGFFVTGEISKSGGAGNANLRIPISGPDGSGHIYTIAVRRAGEWYILHMEVKIEGASQSIVIFDESTTSDEYSWNFQVETPLLVQAMASSVM